MQTVRSALTSIHHAATTEMLSINDRRQGCMLCLQAIGKQGCAVSVCHLLLSIIQKVIDTASDPKLDRAQKQRYRKVMSPFFSSICVWFKAHTGHRLRPTREGEHQE